MNGGVEPGDQRNDRTAEVRARLAEDIAAGRTVSLTPEAMADPALRQLLGECVHDLADGSVEMLPEMPRIPGYTLLGQIGTGGQSEVYLARDDELRRPVAIKVMRAVGGDTGTARTRMLKEARALARVHHPNIVTIYGVVEVAGQVVIVMEWIDGLTLGKLVRALPPMPQPGEVAALRRALGTASGDAGGFEATAMRTFARILRDVARGAEQAHAAGLLHLDIKPANVLVRRNGQPLLVDFGLAREIDLELTHTQSFAGTPIYAAPEQLRRADDEIGATTDVYGLGITLYELIARQQPLRTETFTAALRAVETGRLPRLSSLASVPRDLENIVHKAIAVEPRLRYPTAAAFADDLDAFLADRGVAARPATPWQRVRRRVRAEPWQAVFVLLLVITLPIVTALTWKLAHETAMAEQTRRNQMVEVAQAEAQRLVQSFLFRSKIDPACDVDSDRFTRHFGTDDTYTVASLMMFAEASPPVALRLLDRLPADWQHRPFVHSLRDRIRQGIPFFTPEVARGLADSQDEQVLLALVLDRILEFRDTNSDVYLREIAWPTIRKLLSVQQVKNPLSWGLKAFLAAELGDRIACENACLALTSSFGDNQQACIWRMMAMLPFGPEAALEHGHAFLREHPDDYLVRTMTSGWLASLAQYEPALALVRDLRVDGDRAGRRHLLLAHLFADCGRLDEAERELAAYGPAPEPQSDLATNYLDAIAAIDTVRAAEYAERLLAANPSLAVFETITTTFHRPGQRPDVVDRACRMAVEQHPHRARYRLQLGRRLVIGRDYVGAARMFEGLRIPRLDLDGNAQGMALAFQKVGDWERLGAICDAWGAAPPASPQGFAYYHYYSGIQKSRTGSYGEAREHLQQALAGVQAVRNPATQGPLIAAEALWVDLQAPTASPGDTERRKELIRLASAMPFRTAFPYLVLAEACLVVGDREAARGHLQMAKRLCAASTEGAPVDRSGPADLQGLLASAEQKYRSTDPANLR